MVAKQRRQDEYDRDITQAWWVVRIYAMTTQKNRLPDLKALLQRDDNTAEGQHAILQMLSNRYGIPLRKVVH